MTVSLSDTSLIESSLPAVARDLIHLIGWHYTIMLIQHLPGARIYVPSSISAQQRARHRFVRMVELIGELATARIMEEYRGTTLEIPCCRSALTALRNRHIRARFNEGADIQTLCEENGLSSRSIFHILNLSLNTENIVAGAESS